MCGACKMHSGFQEPKGQVGGVCAHQCGTSVKPARFTGHSLEAALADVAAMSLDSFGCQVEELYNFGLPRTGDEIGAKDFNAIASHA